MTGSNPHISIVTLSVNGLNASIKRHRGVRISVIEDKINEIKPEDKIRDKKSKKKHSFRKYREHHKQTPQEEQPEDT